MNANTSMLRHAKPSPASPRRAGSRLALVSALAAALALAGCAGTSPAYHRYVMQGQVLSLDGDALVVCIGDRDGAQVGQELTVIRHIARTGGAPKAVVSGFRREQVGTARIAEVFDEHYARAQVLSGRLKVNDVVELARR